MPPGRLLQQINGMYFNQIQVMQILNKVPQCYLYIVAIVFAPIFSLILQLVSTALVAITAWLQGNQAKFIMSSAFVILVFRAELAILLGLMLLIELASRRLSIVHLIGWGVVGTILSLGELCTCTVILCFTILIKLQACYFLSHSSVDVNFYPILILRVMQYFLWYSVA